MADVTLVIDAETAKAVRGLVELGQKQLELGQKAQVATKDTSKLDDVTGRLAGHVKGVASSLAGMVGGYLSLQGVMGVLGELEGRLERIATKNNEVAKNTVGLALMNALSGEPSQQYEAGRRGAEHGIKLGPATEIYGAVKGLEGSDKDIDTVMRLVGIGAVEREPMVEIAKAGVLRGVGAERSAYLSALAAKDSPLPDMRSVSEAASTLMQYSSLETGYAALATLSKAGMTGERLRAGSEAFARALGKATLGEGELGKKFGLKGLSETEALLKIRDEAPVRDKDIAAFMAEAGAIESDTTLSEEDRKKLKTAAVEKFAKASFLAARYQLGEEEGRALGMGLMKADDFAKLEQSYKAVTPEESETGLAKAIATMKAENPNIDAALATSRLEAKQELWTAFSPVAEQARDFEAKKQAVGSALQAADIPAVTSLGVDEKSGQANWFGRGYYGVTRGAAYELPGEVPSGYAYAPRMQPSAEQQSVMREANIDALMQKLDAHMSALERNTAAVEGNNVATEQNTAATAGGGGGGGAGRVRNRNEE